MNKDQIETVADKAWDLANEPDTDFEACVLLKDCAFTIKELQSRLESLELEMQEQARIIGMGAERELALVAKVESLKNDAARWKMFVELFDDVNKPYTQRVNKEAFSAYVKSLEESIDCTGAVDAAIRAKEGV